MIQVKRIVYKRLLVPEPETGLDDERVWRRWVMRQMAIHRRQDLIQQYRRNGMMTNKGI